MLKKTVEIHEAMNLPLVKYHSGNSILEFFVRENEKKLSVFTAMGSQKEIANLVKNAQKEYPKYSICDQVSNETELKAMFKAGLRAVVEEKSLKTLEDTLALLKKERSIYMEASA